LSNHGDYESFLMFELSEINSAIEDHDSRAYGFLTVLAAGGPEISESLYVGYSRCVEVSQSVLVRQAAFLQGMHYLNIVCDCLMHKHACYVKDILDSEWWGFGNLERTMDSELYKKVGDDIIQLKSDMGF